MYSEPSLILHAGECHATRQETRLGTVLGSCVAACLYDPVARIAGMNHFLLPGEPVARTGSSAVSALHYGLPAMQALIEAMVALGAQPQRLVAQVFGGASVLPGLNEAQRVGPRNIAFILRYLADAGIALQKQDLGGNQARKVAFDTGAGEAQSRLVQGSLPALALPASNLRLAAAQEFNPLAGSGR